MALLGVYTCNEIDRYESFKNWLGGDAQTVLGYTSMDDWDAPHPGWMLDASYLGGTGLPINWSMPFAPYDAGVAEYQQIADGQHDDRYREWAQVILDSRSGDDGPIYVRPNWELGGEWYPWTHVANENPEVYKAAWAQFASVFHSVSDRFKMVWDTVPDRGPQEHLYPGDDAVGVVSQDHYWMPWFSGDDPQAAFEMAKAATSAASIGWPASPRSTASRSPSPSGACRAAAR